MNVLKVLPLLETVPDHSCFSCGMKRSLCSVKGYLWDTNFVVSHTWNKNEPQITLYSSTALYSMNVGLPGTEQAARIFIDLECIVSDGDPALCSVIGINSPQPVLNDTREHVWTPSGRLRHAKPA